MNEYIEREELKKRFCGHCEDYGKCDEPCFDIKLIDNTPAADVRSVVKGFNKLKDYPSLFECSACGWECGDTIPGDTLTYNFCPNCGAEMKF